MNYYKHESAIVDDGAVIGDDTQIWCFSHIMSKAKLGRNCIIGQNVMIGNNVIVSDSCKIQNNVSLYDGVILEENVFCGPSCVFTNVYNPRAHIERKNEFKKTYVEKGATIGANSTIVCGVRLYAYCFIGAGAVVTKDVRKHALVVGNPAVQIGWVCSCGEVLNDTLVCLREKKAYKLNAADELVLEEINKN